jgi:hypothetical protein
MKFTRFSPLSRKYYTADLPITEEQIERFRNGEHIQSVFAHIPPEWREWIMSGITPAEWAASSPSGQARSGPYDGPEIEVEIVEEPEA